jgi:pyruvate ferredoxin oxidoreductase gamma subunit
VVAFCRINARGIRLRKPILSPELLVVQGPTLMHQGDAIEGLRPDGNVQVNTRKGQSGADPPS